jgi:hypothetical protein
MRGIMNVISLRSLTDRTSKLSGASERLQISKGIRYTNRVLYPLLVVSLVVVFAHLGLKAETATALLWALAGLIAGTALGFFFGIPKILQNEKPASDRTDAQSADKRSLYRQQVNTNLTRGSTTCVIRRPLSSLCRASMLRSLAKC